MTFGELAAILTSMVAIVALVGGYAQFVSKRSGLGFVEFDIQFEEIEDGKTLLIGEIECVIKNVGSSMVIVENVRARVRYRLRGERDDVLNGVEPSFVNRLGQHWFAILDPRTFIQPGVTQRYRKPIAIPPGASVLHVWGSFDYRIQLSLLARLMIRLSTQPPADLDWRGGIGNHTIRRTFKVDSVSSGASQEAFAPLPDE